jgi:hypothetical protein
MFQLLRVFHKNARALYIAVPRNRVLIGDDTRKGALFGRA